jgi:hypothetical protein
MHSCFEYADLPPEKAMPSLANVTLPDGTIQVFYAGNNNGIRAATFWQTSATEWSSPVNLAPSEVPNGQFAQVTACSNANGIAQVWGLYFPTATGLGVIITQYKTLLTSGANWTSWKQLQMPPPPGQSWELCAARSADGRIQLFAPVFVLGDEMHLFTCWESAPNTQSYTAWQRFYPPLPTLYSQQLVVPITANNMSDGRLQLWVVGDAPAPEPLEPSGLITSYKQTTEHNAPWSAWSDVLGDAASGNSLVSALMYGSVQLLCCGPPELFAAVQATPPSGSVGTWEPWPNPLPTPYSASAVTLATLNDGRLQIVLLSDNGTTAPTFLTCYQTNTVSGSPWSGWQTILQLED